VIHECALTAAAEAAINECALTAAAEAAINECAMRSNDGGGGRDK